MKAIEGWHFCNGMELRDGQALEVGRTYTHAGTISMCNSGLHASRRIIDALRYAPGNVCCQVRVWGDVVEDKDKVVARNRLVLSVVDSTNILHEFACQVAEIALAVAEVDDKRCWSAINAKRAWLRGDITTQKLHAAWYAARDAARDAARYAARDAAWDAAWAAARAAAWDEHNDLLEDMILTAIQEETLCAQ